MPLIRPDTPPGFPYPAINHATREEMSANFVMDNPTLRRQAHEARKRAERDVRQLEKDAAQLAKDRERARSRLDKDAEKIRDKALAKARAQKDKEPSASRQPRDKERRAPRQPMDMRGGSSRRGEAAPPVEMAAALARMFSGDEIETPMVSPARGPSTVQAKYHNRVVAVRHPSFHRPLSPTAILSRSREAARAKPDGRGKPLPKIADKDRQKTKNDKRGWLAGLRGAPSIESFVCKDAREIEQGVRR